MLANTTHNFDDATATTPNQTIESSEYRMLGIGDVLSKPVDVGWLVEDLVPLKSVGMVFGASGVGKSHIMLSMALNVAMGRSWFGKDVVQGSVAVLVGEGAGGINKRLQAIAKEHNLTLDNNIPITFSDMPIGIDSDKGFETVVNVLDQLVVPPKLIIVDTLSRHISESKENDNGDMAKFINRLDSLKKRYDATVIFVHHTGKSDQDSARGAYALKANVDFSFSVKGADKSKLISLECDKMKDGDDNLPPMRFKVTGVEVGTNSKGKPITGACVIAANDADFKVTTKLSDNKQLAVDTFNSELEAWRNAFVDGYFNKNATRDAKVKAFKRELDKLEETGLAVKQSDGSYQLADSQPSDKTDIP
jgi:putative DNA primase/helicase